jgi:PAS domain S-box-containing protein
MEDPIKILLVEDIPEDAEMIWKEISKSNISFEKKHVDNERDYISALKSFNPDLILSDFSLPQFNGLKALELKNELNPTIPFILVTGSINEETAVELMKAGADDYIIKENLKRLVSAIDQALKKKAIARSKATVEKDLRQSEKIFSAFLEYCPVYFFFKDNECRPIRLSKNYEEMLGRPVEEAIGKTMYELFPEDLARSMINDDLKIIRNNVAVKVVEVFGDRTFETTKFPILLDGMKNYLAGFTIDITEQKKAEAALKQKVEELERFNDITVDRELKMIDLKKEINELLIKSGEKERYKIVE